MLFTRDALREIAAGEITLAFRRWRRPTVRTGGTLRTRAGVLAIEAVDVVDPEQVGDDHARQAGFEGRLAMLRSLRAGDEPVYRIAFHVAGPDPRAALRERAELDGAERADLDAQLARLDVAARHGPWTHAVLRLIAEHPETRAADLAQALGRDKPSFKRDVRKLKELGLTESLERGYRLSARGRSYLAGRVAQSRTPRSPG